MIAGIWVIQRRLPLRVSRPVEISAVDNQTTYRISMTAEIFCRGIHDDGRAVLDRPGKNGRRCIIDNERNAERTADCSNFGDRKDRQFRIWKCFRVISTGLIVGRPLKILRVNRVNETNLNALVLEGMSKKIPCPAVKIGRAHNVVAGTCGF